PSPYQGEGRPSFLIVVGVVGAFVGGFLLRLLTGRAFSFDFDLTSFAVAVIGAVVFLAVARAIGGRK
ncbi:MAG: GlsB/YeaQ/YmgE family stress response membrane protein, partial [Chloroflexota bacterium]